MSCTDPRYAIQWLNNGVPYPSGHPKAHVDFWNFRESKIIRCHGDIHYKLENGFFDSNGNFELYLNDHLKGMIKDVDYRPLILPCGKCSACRLAYGKHWSYRGLMEAFMHEQNCFLTLTLDDSSLRQHTQYLRLDYLQKFLKRLRKIIKVKIKYLACGEYGSLNLRPHYHLIIFGWCPTDVELAEVNSLGDKVYVSPTLSFVKDEKGCFKNEHPLWPFGHCYIGDVSKESISYVAGYVVKKQELIDKLGGSYKVHKPFITMSRKPGLGFEFFEKYAEDFLDDEIHIDGNRFQVPRYFMKQFEKFAPAAYDKIKQTRIESARLSFENNYTPSRLNVLEEMYDLRLKKKVRNL